MEGLPPFLSARGREIGASLAPPLFLFRGRRIWNAKSADGVLCDMCVLMHSSYERILQGTFAASEFGLDWHPAKPSSGRDMIP